MLGGECQKGVPPELKFMPKLGYVPDTSDQVRTTGEPSEGLNYLWRTWKKNQACRRRTEDPLELVGTMRNFSATVGDRSEKMEAGSPSKKKEEQDDRATSPNPTKNGPEPTPKPYKNAAEGGDGLDRQGDAEKSRRNLFDKQTKYDRWHQSLEENHVECRRARHHQKPRGEAEKKQLLQDPDIFQGVHMEACHRVLVQCHRYKR